MDRRFLLFVTLSFVLLTANALWNARNAPKKPVANVGAVPAGAGLDERPADAQANAANAEADQPDAPGNAPDVAGNAPAEADGAAPAADADAAADAADDPPEAGAGSEPEAPVAPEFVSLGSADADSPYRMLVTITNEGAAVRRIELSSPRYLDLHERGAYLGHLELTTGDRAGLLVQSVGPGTPAAAAGLRVGDRIVGIGRTEIAPVEIPEQLSAALAKLKPSGQLKIEVLRDDARTTLTADLRRRPLEVTRPEAENIRLRGGVIPANFVDFPSLLMTLEQDGAETLKGDAPELPGVDMLSAPWRIVDRSDEAVTFQRRLSQRGLVVTKRYQLAKVDDANRANPDAPAYHLTLEVTVANAGEGDAAKPRQVAYRMFGPNGLPLEGWWYAAKTSRAPGGFLRDILGRYFGSGPVGQGGPKLISGAVEPFESGSLAYMGVDAQYFAAAILPVKESPEETWISTVQSLEVGAPLPQRDALYANVSYRMTTKLLPLGPGEQVTHAYTLFAGPKRPELLAKYYTANDPAYSLDDFVYYGWFGAVAKIMVGLLHVFYGVVRNYGVAIIMLTALVRGGMFPVSRGQSRSMAKLNELKPEMERIKEKYKGDQQKQAKAMQDLYRKHKVNPLAGCLPMFIQLPVFIGLYRGLAVDIELRQAPLFGNWTHWCSNLAAPDMFYNWSGWMPALVTNYLGPYLNLLPLVTIVLFLWQQKMFMPEPTNEQAALQQKLMKYMMVFMGFLFYKVPSGLCLYFIASSLWGIAERKLFPPPASTGLAATGGSGPTPPAKPAASWWSPDRGGKTGQTREGRSAKAKRRK